MKLAKKVFGSFFPALMIASFFAFAQLACAFLLGAMLDQGISGQFLWLLPLFGLLIASSFTIIAVVFISEETDGYQIARLHISPAFLFFYALITACFLCFILFGVLSLVSSGPLLHKTGLGTIALSVSVLVIDGLGFHGAIALRGKNE